MKTSGILNDSRKEEKSKKKNYGGKPARARRRERRAEERRRATTLSSSPPPLETSAVVIDAAGEYMGGSDAWIDMGHIKNEVKVVGQQFGNNFTQADHLQGYRQLQGCQQLQGDRQLQGHHLQGNQQLQESKENLNAEPWYFGSIPLQTARDLLYESGQLNSFLIKDSDKKEGYMILKLQEKNVILEKEIFFDDKYYHFENDARRFLSLEILVDYLEVRCNFMALQNKDDLKKVSQVRLRRSMERLTFCWFCLSYNNQTRFCTVLKIWRKIDYGNCVVQSGHNRNAVDRYKEEYGNEHKVEILLFRSKSDLNQNEKSNAEKWKAEIKATKYFEENKERLRI